MSPLLFFFTILLSKQYMFEVNGKIQSTKYLCKIRGLTAVAMKNPVFLDVTSCGSCKNRRLCGR
jgi:hypothetical protein